MSGGEFQAHTLDRRGIVYEAGNKTVSGLRSFRDYRAVSGGVWRHVGGAARPDHRSARVRSAPRRGAPPERVAQGILDTLTSTDMNGWEISTAAEACVALGRVDQLGHRIDDAPGKRQVGVGEHLGRDSVA